MNLLTVLYCLSLPKRGHVLRRFKIRIMNTPFTMEFGLAPLGVHVATFISCAIVVYVAAIILNALMS